MEIIQGIPVSPGVVIGRVFTLDDNRRRIVRRHIPADTVDEQITRLNDALKASLEELGEVFTQAEQEMGTETANIFRFHIGMLADNTLIEPIRNMIRDQLVTTEFAVYRTFSNLAGQFAAKKDSVFTTKVNDIHDLSARVLHHLIGSHASRLNELDHEAVIIANDLTPSQTAGFNRDQVIAFATDLGGQTSHTAIVARALGIPAVVGCGRITDHATDNQAVIVDGDRGLVIFDPTEEKLDEYQAYIEQSHLVQISLDELKNLPSQTRDGVDITLTGNIEFPEEISTVLSSGGQSVGLYRTEFLFLTSTHEPTEEEHFQAYQKCVELLNGKPLTIRTVDLGADKYTQSQFETPERNPFLGLRSIRYCLRSLPMFKTQLRAILRASALGPIRVMFPLVTNPSEFRHARMLIRDTMEDLAEEGIAFDPDIKVGMMIEVPAAALMASTFAREVDFFSIGTNDLVQYTLAVDRTNERVAHLFNFAHPAVAKLVREVVRAARRRDVPVSCCGEAAGEPEYALLLIGLGLRTLSVTASSIPRLKRLIRSVTITQCERIAKKALTLESDVQVSVYLRDQLRKVVPESTDAAAV